MQQKNPLIKSCLKSTSPTAAYRTPSKVKKITDVSRHGGGPIKRPPYTPQYNSTVMVRGVSGGVLNWAHMTAERGQPLGKL